jgi:hypothetical protein
LRLCSERELELGSVGSECMLVSNLFL